MSDQPDVKCECGHEASEHHFDGCMVCPCEIGVASVYRSAYAASEAALAEAQESRAISRPYVVGLEKELAEERHAGALACRAALDLQRALDEARAEVERLKEQRVKQNRSHCELTEQMHADIAAERQRIADGVRERCHGRREIDGILCRPKGCHCLVCNLADRIASGYFAAEKEEQNK